MSESAQQKPQEQEQPPPPAQDEPPSPIAKGAKWGALAGAVLAQLYIGSNSPLGFYVGPPDMLVVFAFFIGLGGAIGAGFAWLSTRTPDDDERFPG
jgi:predicted lipid-binding transport protein (Tim44 family)